MALTRPGRPWVIGHRGALAIHPGNTMASFRAAIDAGADLVECDVRRLRDGHLVLFHDPRAARRAVAALDLAELRAAMPAGAEPALLADLLDLAGGRAGVDVEIKEPGYEGQVVRLLAERHPGRPVVVTSFLDAVVAAVKHRAPELAAGLLLDGIGRPRPPLARLRECRADFVAPSRRLARPAFLAAAAAAGLPALVWTVNSAGEMGRLLADPAVAGVITDDPARAVAVRDAQAGPS